MTNQENAHPEGRSSLTPEYVDGDLNSRTDIRNTRITNCNSQVQFIGKMIHHLAIHMVQVQYTFSVKIESFMLICMNKNFKMKVSKTLCTSIGLIKNLKMKFWVKIFNNDYRWQIPKLYFDPPMLPIQSVDKLTFIHKFYSL